MNAETGPAYTNGLAQPVEQEAMAEETRVSLPGWLLPMMVTLVLAFVGNLGYSMYWAGQVTSNQVHLAESLGELKTEVRQLRADNQALREQLAGVTATRQR